MRVLLIAAALFLCSCSSGNTLGQPAPHWTNYRGVAIPVEDGVPQLTAPVIAQLEQQGVSLDTPLERQRVIEVIIEQNGL